jgi:hypothetical protein
MSRFESPRAALQGAERRGLPDAGSRSDSAVHDAEERSVDIQFVTSMAVITPDAEQSRKLYVSALGLPLQAGEGDDYLHSEDIEGAKHFGVCPLRQAAQACFGSR